MNPSRWNSHGNRDQRASEADVSDFSRSDIVLALKEVVPSMEGGFIINTTVGEVSFHDADAEAIAGFVRALLEAMLVARPALSRKAAVPSSRACRCSDQRRHRLAVRIRRTAFAEDRA